MKRLAAPRFPAPRMQAGIAALGMASLMLVFCAILLGASYLGRRAVDTRTQLLEQQAGLDVAQQLVSGFTSLHGRLPCPAREKNAGEDCSMGAKGWLPIQSLEKFSTKPDNIKPRTDIRYVLYRGGDTPGDPDLATNGLVGGLEAYAPTLADNSPVGGSYPVILSATDLCGKLRQMFRETQRWQLGNPLSGGPARRDRAHISYPHATDRVLNTAYGLAAAAPGTGASGSGVNADFSSPALEDPARSHNGAYSDLVRGIEVASIYDTMQCATVMASLDSLAIAQTWTDDSTGLKQSNVSGSDNVVGVQRYFVISDSLFIASAVIDTINGIYLLVKSLQEAAASAGVVGLQWRLPHFTAAVATAATGLALNGIDLARSGVNLGVDKAYMDAYMNVSKEAQASSVWIGGKQILEQADRKGGSDE